MVHVYDATNLFLINRQLADEYILDGDVATVCKVITDFYSILNDVTMDAFTNNGAFISVKLCLFLVKLLN